MRCRKCGERFEVWNPAPPPVPEPPLVPPPPGREPPVPEPPVADVPPPAPDLPVADVSRKAETVPQIAPPPAPAAPSTIPASGNITQEPRRRRRRSLGEPEQPRWERTRRDQSKRNRVFYLTGLLGAVFIGLTVLLLFYPAFWSDLGESLEGVRIGTAWGPASAVQISSPDVRVVSGHYMPNPQGTTFFVLRGAVRDTRKGDASAPIRLRATLRNAEKKVLAEKTFLAGDQMAGIGLPEAISLENMAVEEGWVPFIAVFFDPGAVSDFFVTVERG